MMFKQALGLLALCSSIVNAIPAAAHIVHGTSPTVQKRSGTYYSGPVITPKAFIISLVRGVVNHEINMY